MKIGEKFIQEFELQGGTQLTRAIASQLLVSVLVDNRMKGYEDREYAKSQCFEDDILEEGCLVQLCDIASEYCNDLMYVLVDSASKDGVGGKLIADGHNFVFRKIIDWAIKETADGDC